MIVVKCSFTYFLKHKHVIVKKTEIITLVPIPGKNHRGGGAWLDGEEDDESCSLCPKSVRVIHHRNIGCHIKYYKPAQATYETYCDETHQKTA